MTRRERARPEEGRAWPRTREEAETEWDRREASYLGEAYTDEESRLYGLFQARDIQTNEVTVPPRRITADQAFLVDVDVAAIATGGLVLQVNKSAALPGQSLPPPDSDPASLREGIDAAMAVSEVWLQQAKEIWRRSHVGDKVEGWARKYCNLGRVGFQVVLKEGKAHIVAHDPRDFTVRRDELRINIVSVTIDIEYEDEPVLDVTTGQLTHEGDLWRSYRALLTSDDITVFVDGDRSAEQSGTNTLGVPPFIEVDYGAGPDGFPLWSAHGTEDGLAAVDSLYTQALHLGAHHANPILRLSDPLESESSSGDEVDGPDLAGQGGRILETKDAEWLETSMSGSTFLSTTATALRSQIQETCPGFLFVDAGATPSGRALSYRAGAFVMQVTPRRERFYLALAGITAMGVVLERGDVWNDSFVDIFTVDGGPVVPADISAALSDILDSRNEGLLTNVDAIRASMALGNTPEGDPEEYLLRTQNEQRGRQSDAVGALRAVNGRREEVSPGRVIAPSPETELADDGGAPLEPVDAPEGQAAETAVAAQVSLNGAQIASALEIVGQVARRELPRPEGVAMLKQFFGLDDSQAESLMGSVGASFFVDADA